jgi:hypothetical protein
MRSSPFSKLFLGLLTDDLLGKSPTASWTRMPSTKERLVLLAPFDQARNPTRFPRAPPPAPLHRRHPHQSAHPLNENSSSSSHPFFSYYPAPSGPNSTLTATPTNSSSPILPPESSRQTRTPTLSSVSIDSSPPSPQPTPLVTPLQSTTGPLSILDDTTIENDNDVSWIQRSTYRPSPHPPPHHALHLVRVLVVARVKGWHRWSSSSAEYNKSIAP